MKRKLAVVFGIALVLLSGTAVTLWLRRAPAVPACAFAKSVRTEAKQLTLYCADERHLPNGVVSHTAEATYASGAVLYRIDDGSSTLSVSLQTKPAKDQLANFVPNLIPLSLSVTTPVGKANVGVSNDRTIISLPTTTNTWILITGPEDYNPDNASRLLKAFTQAN